MRQDIRLTTLIHENMAVVMTFVFSREPLNALVNNHFKGNWKYLERFVFELPEERATRAAVELAALLRLLDDDQRINEFLEKSASWRSFGTVFNPQGGTSPLSLREVANKVIHSARLEWNFDRPKDPVLISHAAPDQQQRHNWVRAEIKIIDLAALCGQLLS